MRALAISPRSPGSAAPDRLPHPFDGSANLHARGRTLSFRIDRHRRQREANGTEPLKPRRARKVVAAGQRRSHRRRQHRAHGYGIPSLQRQVGPLQT
jgi:hypothetical protein